MNFYGYTVRETTRAADRNLAFEWLLPSFPEVETFPNNDLIICDFFEQMKRLLNGVAFWMKQGNGVESFLVWEPFAAPNLQTNWDAEPLGFYQVEHYSSTQVRLHFQASPVASRKKILRGITRLVPLIEKALALRGVRAIFFTSHSLEMVAFMEKRLHYTLRPEIDGGADGVVMGKKLFTAENAESAEKVLHHGDTEAQGKC